MPTTMEVYTESEVTDILKQRVRAAGTLAAAGDELRISPQFLSQVIQGRVDVSEGLGKKLGFDRPRVFVKRGRK